MDKLFARHVIVSLYQAQSDLSTRIACDLCEVETCWDATDFSDVAAETRFVQGKLLLMGVCRHDITT